MQVFALAKAMAGREQPADATPPIAAAIFATSAALAMHREAELGIRTGHAEVMAIIEDYIARWD
jgi:hypothetical protein